MRGFATAATTLAVAVMISWVAPSKKLAAEQNEPGASAAMTVTVAKTKRECFVDGLQVSGLLSPRSEMLVRPDREGLQISQVLVEPGDTVVSGQVLARLAPAEGQTTGGTTVAIQAPAAGVISARAAVVGALASARAEPLFRIVAKGEMELVADVPVKKLSALAVDQPAKIEMIGIGEMPGRVRLISTVINPTTQLGQVRLFVGSDSRLRTGVFGRATIEVGRRCGAAVPLSAVLYGQGGTVVQVVRDGRIETRRVTIGLFAKGLAEVREGLSEGDLVVARAGSFVREGDRVRAVTPTDPSAKR